MTVGRRQSALVGVLLAAGCGGDAAAGPPVRPDPDAPTSMRVTCDPTSTVVSTTTVDARRDGLHLVVTDSSGADDTYLYYRYRTADGWQLGGGDPVPSATSRRVLPVPPGWVSLRCSSGSGTREWTPAEVYVQDPGRHFRRTTLADLGCSSSAIPGWTFGGGRGPTPGAAVEALLAKASLPVGELQAEPAPIGYIDASTTTYLVDRNGQRWATAVVTQTGSRFEAQMDRLC